MGELPRSGLELRPEFAAFDATQRYEVGALRSAEDPECIAGAILTGAKLPTDCTAYGIRCTPRRPLGAPMVSTEGTCAAFHAAGRTATTPLEGSPA